MSNLVTKIIQLGEEKLYPRKDNGLGEILSSIRLSQKTRGSLNTIEEENDEE